MAAHCVNALERNTALQHAQALLSSHSEVQELAEPHVDQMSDIVALEPTPPLKLPYSFACCCWLLGCRHHHDGNLCAQHGTP
jgi:hypothetical protein